MRPGEWAVMWRDGMMLIEHPTWLETDARSLAERIARQQPGRRVVLVHAVDEVILPTTPLHWSGGCGAGGNQP